MLSRYAIFRRAKVFEIIISVLTLVAIIASATVYYFQLKVFQNQLEISKDQEDNQLRAYVGPQFAWISRFDGANHIQISTSIKNFGATPAYNVDDITVYRVDFPRANNDDANEGIDFDKQNQFGVLYPTDTITYNSNFTLSPDEIEAIKNGKKVFILQGKTYYRSLFGVDLWSTHCFIFDLSAVQHAANIMSDDNNGDSCSNGQDGS